MPHMAPFLKLAQELKGRPDAELCRNVRSPPPKRCVLPGLREYRQQKRKHEVSDTDDNKQEKVITSTAGIYFHTGPSKLMI